jgi:hypothetical protein
VSHRPRQNARTRRQQQPDLGCVQCNAEYPLCRQCKYTLRHANYLHIPRAGDMYSCSPARAYPGTLQPLTCIHRYLYVHILLIFFDNIIFELLKIKGSSELGLQMHFLLTCSLLALRSRIFAASNKWGGEYLVPKVVVHTGKYLVISCLIWYHDIIFKNLNLQVSNNSKINLWVFTIYVFTI